MPIYVWKTCYNDELSSYGGGERNTFWPIFIVVHAPSLVHARILGVKKWKETLQSHSLRTNDEGESYMSRSVDADNDSLIDGEPFLVMEENSVVLHSYE